MEKIRNFKTELQNFSDSKGTVLWGWFDGYTKEGIDKRLKEQFSTDDIAAVQTHLAEMKAAIENGADVSEEDMEKLQTILDFLSLLQTEGIGENITSGISEGMMNTDWTATGEDVASDIEGSLETSLDSHSPAQRMVPLGQNITAGIAQGMLDYSFEAEATAITEKVKNSLNSVMTVTTLRSIGLNAMYGLADGIRAGRTRVVAAMREAARAAAKAAKAELKIASPSRVFRDEVGTMVMRGFGAGIERETANQAKIIANAARYLTGEAKEVSIGYNTSYDQRRYDQSSSVNVSGNSFFIRDEQDIHGLAVELATLTRRQQRGKGLRMA